MDRGFHAGAVAVVPGVNGTANESVDVAVAVNARVMTEMSPAAVPVGRGEPTVAGVGTGEVSADTNRESMDLGFDAGGAAVPDVNGNVNENVDVDVNARVRREIGPAAVPVGRGEPTVAGVGTGEGTILPPQSERWLSGIFRAIPRTQGIRSFARTPEMVIVLLGLASLISLIIIFFDVITTKSFRPLTVAVFFSAGGYCVLLIQRPRYLDEADQVLAELMEARAEASKRVITKEERRLLFHYFTLRPPNLLENAFSCEGALSGASTLSEASTPSGDGDGRRPESFSRKALDQSSSDTDEARRAQGGHPLNATVPPRDGSLGRGESSVPTRGQTRSVENETRRGERRSGSALRKLFGGPRPDGIDVWTSMAAGARAQQLPDRAAVGETADAPREEEGVSAGACSTDDAVAGCSKDRHACSPPKERGKYRKKGKVHRRLAGWSKPQLVPGMQEERAGRRPRPRDNEGGRGIDGEAV